VRFEQLNLVSKGLGGSDLMEAEHAEERPLSPLLQPTPQARATQAMVRADDGIAHPMTERP
jgi:hypothetical protein